MDAALQSPASTPRARNTGLTVVKLGGSVVRDAALEPWLEVIGDARQPIVIVPGGGALAAEVRQCQRQLGFGDATAHRMALLAMDQLALAVAGLRAGFDVGTREADLRAILVRGHVAVWAPSGLVAGRNDLEATWQLTSDSLALWLTGRLGARDCYLIKSVSMARRPRSASALVADGIVDEAFAGMLARVGVSCAIFGQGDQAALGACFANREAPPGLLVE